MDSAHNIYEDYCATTDPSVTPAQFADQLEYEEGMHLQGRERVAAGFKKNAAKAKEDDTQYGMTLINQFIPAVSREIRAAYDHAVANLGVNRGRASAMSSLVRFIEAFGDVDAIAALTLRNCFKSLSARKPQAVTNSATALSRQLIHELQYMDVKRDDRRLADCIRKMTDKKTGYEKKAETFSFVLRHNNIVPEHRLDDGYRLELGMNLLECARRGTKGHIQFTDVVELVGNTKVTKKYITISDALLKRVTRLQEDLLEMAAVHKPMLIKPVPWAVRESRYRRVLRDDKGRVVKDSDGKRVYYHPMEMTGGYVSSHIKPVKFCKSRNRAQQAAIVSQEFPGMLAGVNAAMHTPYRVRKKMLELQTYLYSQDFDWATDLGIPHSQPAEEPVAPRDKDTNPDSLKDFKRARAEWFRENIERAGLCANYKLMLDVARELEDAPEFYNVWQVDSRGRGYPLGFLHCQGADPMKAMVEFAEGKPITKDNVFYLKLTVANLIADCPWSGDNIDKQNLHDRVQWVDDNMDKLVDLARNYMDDQTWTSFDKPFYGLAACWDLLGWYEEGDGYMSHLPCGLDGSCSGLQILGAAFRCEKTAAAVNLIPNDKPADIYSMVATGVMEELLKEVADQTEEVYENQALQCAKDVFREEGGSNVTAMLNYIESGAQFDPAKVKEGKAIQKARKAFWAHFERHTLCVFMRKAGLQKRRKLVKRSVMTFAYSSKEFGFRQQVMEDTMIPAFKALKKKFGVEFTEGSKAFRSEHGFPWHGNGGAAAGVLAKLVYKKVNEEVVKAGEAMRWMSDCAKLISKQQRPVTWTTPLGFPVVQDYKKTEACVIDLVMTGRKYRRYQMTMHKTATKPGADGKPVPQFDSSKASSAIAPNVVHSLDSSLMWLLVSNAKKEGINNFALIHDDFGTHVADTPRFFNIIRESLVQLFTECDFFARLKEEFAKQLPEELRNDLPPLPAKGTFDLELVKQALHAFA